MIELIALIVVILGVTMLIRPGKARQTTPPIVIQRPGQYHITLAPQLGAARSFIEALAEQIATSVGTGDNSATLCFEVHDPAISSSGFEFYLLAVMLRNSRVYCQAITPLPLFRDKDSHLDNLLEYSSAVMANIPAGDNKPAIDEKVGAAVAQAARACDISIRPLAR